MLISDRDGVLFDTCRANLESYIEASKIIGLQTNINELAMSIHSGLGISSFFSSVWGALSESDLKILRETKIKLFLGHLSQVRLNLDFVDEFLAEEINPYLVTRASLSSSHILLDHFKIHHFGERVISVPESSSKLTVIENLSLELKISKSKFTVVDDSLEVIDQSNNLGCVAIHYPHFCDLRL
jgi:phosphoglycolate phosphatase-like HAD superfamily hydrolase